MCVHIKFTLYHQLGDLPDLLPGDLVKLQIALDGGKLIFGQLELLYKYINISSGAEDMAQWLSTLAALAEDQVSVPRVHLVACNHL